MTEPTRDHRAWWASSRRPTTRAGPPAWPCGPTRSRSASTKKWRPRWRRGCPRSTPPRWSRTADGFTLILEDIVGARQGDQIEACGPEVAAAALEEMAGLHAPCWEAPDLAGLEWLNRVSVRVRRVSGHAGVLTLARVPGALRRPIGARARRNLPVLRRSPALVPEGPDGTAHGQPRRFSVGQPPLPARPAATRGGRLADLGLGRCIARCRVLHRRVPQRRGPAVPRGRPADPLPRRPPRRRRHGLFARPTSTTTRAATRSGGSSWPLWLPWWSSAPTGGT